MAHHGSTMLDRRLSLLKFYSYMARERSATLEWPLPPKFYPRVPHKRSATSMLQWHLQKHPSTRPSPKFPPVPRKQFVVNVDHAPLRRAGHRFEICTTSSNVLCLLRQMFLLSVSPAAKIVSLKVQPLTPPCLRCAFLFNYCIGCCK